MSPDPTERPGTTLLPAMELSLLGLLTFLGVFVMRLEAHQWPAWLLVESVFHFALPVFLLSWFAPRIRRARIAGKQKQVVYWVQFAALFVAIAPLVGQFATRKFGFGEGIEFVLLATFLYATWLLTVFSRCVSLERASFTLSSSLILFTCLKSPSTLVYVFVSIYSLVALWWLFGQYWNRLESKAIDGYQRNIPLRSVTLLCSYLLLVSTGATLIAWNVSVQTTSLRGFMPFSGGSSWEDEFTRSGVGDGEMLAAGSNATTTGAVDSDQFIEDDKPSIYDIMSETFSGPMKIKNRSNRAVALEAKAKHLHQVIQSEQEGKAFRTVRHPPRNERLELETRCTDALFFVEGSVPARFTIDRFDHFDGWDWTKADLIAKENRGSLETRNTPIVLNKSTGVPWFVIQNLEREYLPYLRTHRVKMMRLNTDTLPAPAFLKSWHIHRVEDKSLFYWNDRGMVAMQGAFIPTHTMIEMISRVPNYHVLRNTENLQLVNHCNSNWEMIDKLLGVGTESGTSVGTFDSRESDPDHPFIQIAQNKSTARVILLAEQWSSDCRPGWNQVEAIVNRLRTDFQLDASWVADPDGRDSIGQFLDQRGGPSYLFATTATQLLRAAGYRTRLARGFLVQEKDFDRQANQSVVRADNAHVWPEVCLDGWHWIPVEPTPGFPIPFGEQTFWQWVQTQFASSWVWIVNHSFLVAALICLVFFGYRFRRELVVMSSNVLWLLAFILFPHRRLKTTRQLIDVRFWAAGYSRPASASMPEWISRIDSALANDFVRCWLIQNYCSLEGTSPREIRSACRTVVIGLTFRKIKELSRQVDWQ